MQCSESSAWHYGRYYNLITNHITAAFADTIAGDAGSDVTAAAYVVNAPNVSLPEQCRRWY